MTNFLVSVLFLFLSVYHHWDCVYTFGIGSHFELILTRNEVAHTSEDSLLVFLVESDYMKSWSSQCLHCSQFFQRFFGAFSTLFSFFRCCVGSARRWSVLQYVALFNSLLSSPFLLLSLGVQKNHLMLILAHITELRNFTNRSLMDNDCTLLISYYANEAYLEPCQTSKMEYSTKIVNGF